MYYPRFYKQLSMCLIKDYLNIYVYYVKNIVAKQLFLPMLLAIVNFVLGVTNTFTEENNSFVSFLKYH